MLALISFLNVVGAIFAEAYALRLLRGGRIRALPWPDFSPRRSTCCSKGTSP